MKITQEDTFNQHPLSTSWKNNQGLYVDILRVIEALMTDMIQRRNQVFFAMFVVKFPANSAHLYPNDNELFSSFMDTFTRYYSRKGCDPRYCWSREISSTGQTHYHIVLLLNGDHIRNGYPVLNKAIEVWQRRLGINNAGGLVDLDESLGKYGGKMIKRNDPEIRQIFNKCFQRASYLAKCYSKENTPAGINKFGSSRLY